MVGCWAEGWVVWGGGVQASDWEEFGTDWRSVVVAISEGVELGSVMEIWWNRGWFWGGRAVEG